MKEIWKEIKFKENGILYDYSKGYQISNLGNIKYLPKIAGMVKRKEKISKGYKDKDGYLRAYLCKNNKIKSIGIHRLVALLFLPNPNNFPQINHKNEIKSDNVVTNLEWCDCKYNINYGNRTAKAIASRKAKKYERSN